MISIKALWVSLAVWSSLLYLGVPTLLVRTLYGSSSSSNHDSHNKEAVGAAMTNSPTPVMPDAELPPLRQESSTYECHKGLVFLTGATGSVGSLATKQLLDQGFCVRIFTPHLSQARTQLAFLEENLDTSKARLEFVEGQLGDGSVLRAFEPRESSGYTSVTHVLFAAAGGSASKDMDAIHHRGVAECAEAAAQSGSVRSMVVISAAWVSKPYSLSSILFNSMYDNLPSAKHLQGEDALRSVVHNQDCAMDSNDEGYAGNQTCSSGGIPLSYVILRSGHVTPDEDFDVDEDIPQGIKFSQEDAFRFSAGGRGGTMSHSQLAHAAVAALKVQGKYTVEVSGSGKIDPEDVSQYDGLSQDDDAEFDRYYSNRTTTITVQDVERVHAQAVTDFYNILFTLFMGTALLVGMLGWTHGLLLSMTLYLLTMLLWMTFLSNRTVWDCLASQMQPKNLPMLKAPGMSFVSIQS